MTQEQFDELFKSHSFDEARAIVRKAIIDMGKSTNANDTKFMLREKAVDGVKDVKIDVGNHAAGTSTTANGYSPAGLPPAGLPVDSVKAPPSTADVVKSSESEEDELTKAIRAAEEDARRKDEEARKQREAADILKKKLEEARRKAEEERKKKDEDRKKAESSEHYKTSELVDTLKITGQAYLVGPAGTGKTTLAIDACCKLFKVDKSDPAALSKVFAQISFSPDTTKGEMIGMTDVNGIFHESEIVRVFRDGGVILFDEMDNADASMLVKLNTALANGFIATPKGQVKKNNNTYIICTANTYGTGPDAMYVGRTRLDAATLDRFTLCTIAVDYDVRLEACIMNPLSKANREWLTDFVKKCRDAIQQNKLRRLCTTRMVVNASKFMAAGKDPKFIMERFLASWSDQERKAIA